MHVACSPCRLRCRCCCRLRFCAAALLENPTAAGGCNLRRGSLHVAGSKLCGHFAGGPSTRVLLLLSMLLLSMLQLLPLPSAATIPGVNAYSYLLYSDGMFAVCCRGLAAVQQGFPTLVGENESLLTGTCRCRYRHV